MARDFIANLGPILIAATGFLALIGGGLRFVWKKVESRFEGIEQKLAECHERDERKDGQLEAVVWSLHLTIDEIERIDPGRNRTVQEVRDLLRLYFPIDPNTPAAMAALLRRIP
ncbi:hypothetical protein QH494_15920 [Sphingomonas sp. AR_OL41]|uniref:hypothetical protein n=1 Tax=Sphingomonas sp. AR_OL41 TaxID=3042729 RepID=UPI002480335C|nr:hypothetical protein [Sphingomonas sp. AR_OL41]MDH7973679.1 hypothetical protein [Sphingomonas sp. AR_OL41]